MCIRDSGYVGDYILDLAGEILASEGARFAHMDEEQGVKEIGNLAREKMVDLIRADLSLIGVEFDNWFSEGTLFQHGEYDKALELLRENNYLSQRDGALWFNSSVMGDDRDNVVVRSSGEPTYFASDIAYHYNKFIERDFDAVVNIWGADHLGHVPRMKLSLIHISEPTRPY